jgi:lactoylglutathione lyase
MELKLLVIRTPDIKRLADFYSLLGLTVDYHKHGNSPFHYSATIGKTVLEIYPLTKSQSAADKNLRLGFELNNFEETIQALKQAGTPFTAEPAQTDFGFMAIITDPDERKIELYRN